MSGSQKRLALPVKILIAMILGGIVGFFAGPQISKIAFVGDIFVRLLKMCIYPLIFFSIISGISQVTDMKRLGRVGGCFFIYWCVSSAIAAFIGLAWGLVLKPGAGIELAEKAGVPVISDTNIMASFINWIPNNPFASLANGDVIQIIVFAIISGIVLAGCKETSFGKTISDGVNALNELVSKIVALVINLAPFGVFALSANLTGTLGGTVIGSLGKMLLCIYLAMGTMLLIIYPIFIKTIGKLSPIRYFKNIYPVLVMAFSTCSSSATLPVTMKVSKERLGVPEDMVNLIAPPAATINMHGSALEMPIYAVFAAQLYGINLPLSSMLLIIFLGMIMSAGAAGMPGSGIMMIAILLEILGLPLTIVPWIAGVYYLIDMPSTTMNVTGDTVGMTTIASVLNEIDRNTFNAPKAILENS